MRVDTEFKEQKEIKEEIKPKEPNFDDIESSYLYWINFMPETTYQEYVAKKKCVKLGKELLPADGGKGIEDLRTEALGALQDAMPKERVITFGSEDIAGKKYPVYQLTAEDAGTCQAETERLDCVRMDFKSQQYEKAISELEEVDNKILHILIEKNIISSVSSEYIMKQIITQKFLKKKEQVFKSGK